MPALTHILQSLTEDDYPGIGRYVWRPEGGRREWSQGLIRLYGRIEAPRCEAEFMACVHPDDRLRVEGETEAFLTGDANSYTRSFRIVRPDRSVRYVIDRARIERDAQGCVTGIFGLNMDVTDLPEMTKSGVDAETEIVGGRADDMSRVLTDRERFDFGQRTSGLALADIDYQAGTVSLDAVGAQLYGFGKGP
ncbi:PAS domain-containing protein [Marivita sp.]|uniref:PAS domain-containing protein n=1 Tax=Marivita sp. TaxID=2003365 RepID=UPI003B528554